MGFLEKIVDFFDSIIEWIFDLVIDVVLAFVGLLPGIPGVDLMIDLLSSVPSQAFYALHLTQFSFGFSIYMASLVSRFFLRRIPVIG